MERSRKSWFGAAMRWLLTSLSGSGSGSGAGSFQGRRAEACQMTKLDRGAKLRYSSSKTDRLRYLQLGTVANRDVVGFARERIETMSFIYCYRQTDENGLAK